MLWFFRRSVPDINRVLLVESGSRRIAERLLPLLRSNHGPQVSVDLVTCYPGLPEGYPESTVVFRTPEQPDRRALFAEIAAGNYPLLGIVCSGEPILLKWKLVLAARLRAKVFIVNENADYFFLDYSHWRILVRLGFDRAGLAGPSAARNLASLALFPLTLAYLLTYAAWVHSARLLRKAVRLI
ncbi:MAG TPA: hypothetical protein VN428_20165 [Bryobacteraceae bacterium]|nr:hypothetical protein [Bryobacteraceae bacterium]